MTADAAGERLKRLLDCGFSREQAAKVSEAIDLPATADIDRKPCDLRALGFADPTKMVTSFPSILRYAINNIRGTLADLRALGFADPVKIVAGSPTILGCARERACCYAAASVCTSTTPSPT